MSSQPGWHPDPVPPSPGQPAQLRYWDGTRWTEHTAPSQAPAAEHYAYGAAHPATSYAAGGPATTPDGVPLAGWWLRVAALVMDWVVVTVVGVLVALPWWRDFWHSYSDYMDQALNSTDSSTLDTAQFQRDVAGPLVVISLVQFAIGFVYHVGFLMWKQATPGKLVANLRVRLRERPGRMPIGTVLLRWGGQYGIGVLGLLPVLGCLWLVYKLLDYLWPLWDGKKQAIHDKIAKTNVVRIR